MSVRHKLVCLFSCLLLLIQFPHSSEPTRPTRPLDCKTRPKNSFFIPTCQQYLQDKSTHSINSDMRVSLVQSIEE